MNTVDGNLVNNAYKWLNAQIKAEKVRRKVFVVEGVEVNCCGTYLEKEIHIHNLGVIANIIGIENFRADWSGNKQNNTNYDIVWFVYNNYKFFELINKDTV